jgi:hypothetical protein
MLRRAIILKTPCRLDIISEDVQRRPSSHFHVPGYLGRLPLEFRATTANLLEVLIWKT